MGLSAKGNCVEKLPAGGVGGGEDGGGDEGGCADPGLVEPPPQDTQMSRLRKQESQILLGEGFWETDFIFSIPFQPKIFRPYMMYFLVIK